MTALLAILFFILGFCVGFLAHMSLMLYADARSGNPQATGMDEQ